MVRLSCRDKTERQVPTLFAMDKITQTIRYRQALICYAKKYGVTCVQIDVKFVPQVCMIGQEKTTKWYQYTFIDEYSRFRYLEAFPEHSTYSSALFIQHCVRRFPYAIECVQTDNGCEFTNRLSSTKNPKPTLFEKTLAQLGIRHKLIKPYTPRHNGKVERSHRKALSVLSGMKSLPETYSSRSRLSTQKAR